MSWGERERLHASIATISNGSACSGREVERSKLKFEMKIKRAVTTTGTLYETTTLMEAFYFGGMAESLFSVE